MCTFFSFPKSQIAPRVIVPFTAPFAAPSKCCLCFLPWRSPGFYVPLARLRQAPAVILVKCKFLLLLFILGEVPLYFRVLRSSYQMSNSEMLVFSQKSSTESLGGLISACKSPAVRWLILIWNTHFHHFFFFLSVKTKCILQPLIPNHIF